eukprot:TRINITY_DN22552_c0_g1_i1.p1 TRINITY_DN22552_c0_g1~~TRINITY_DN22552_c0_g1_i1.p1  ORF type:complete len:889 (+),score=370.19 TRINITY_DN22552_c0_g1_i1:119-2785(+)
MSGPQDASKEQPQMQLPGVYDNAAYEDPLPFAGLEKSQVLQEVRVLFGASKVQPRACLQAAVKLMYLLAQGEEYTATEATDVFFGSTKLFQCPDRDLRRMVYLLMKELSQTAEQVFIATQTLCKDINSDTDMYKANAIRTLRMITEPNMLGPGERYLKQAVVDRNNTVSSAAIVTGLHLMDKSPDIVKKWSSEVGEALKQRSNMVQYHALALQHRQRKNDRLYVLRLVQQVNSLPIRSPLALCLLIKMCQEIVVDDFASNQELFQFIVSNLRHGSEMVVFEAAKAICSVRNLTAKELTPVVLALQLYLSSHKPVLKFAALRLLTKMADTHPLAVTSCSIDMEALISDPNRNVATLAITTLLKTGSEFSIDRLMKQISKFLGEISDEFKSVVIESMKVLCAKFPHKHHVLLQFLSEALREEGGFEFKSSVVETIISIIETVPQAKEEGLLQLCELIEDCEHNKIAQRVIYLLGQEGPGLPAPNKYVRFIYNRVLLEAPSVRAAAVSALAKFAICCPPLRESISTLLQRAARDNDDEVRDRAAFYMALIEHTAASGDDSASELFIGDVGREVRSAQKKPSPVDAAAAAAAGAAPAAAPGGLSAALGVVPEEDKGGKWVDNLMKVKQLRDLGKPFKTSEPHALTEKDNEYVVTCVKHVYVGHVVLQFRVQNTLEDMAFRKVNVSVDLSADEDLATLKPQFAVPCKRVGSGEEQSVFVCYARDPDAGFVTGTAPVTLSFIMADACEDEADEDVSGDADEYPLPEELVVNLSDYLAPRWPMEGFEAKWKALGEDVQSDVTFELSTMKNLQVATDEIIDFYTFAPLGESRNVPTDGKAKSHVITMCGAVCAEPPIEVAIRAKIFLTTSGGVALDLSVRGGDEELRGLLQESLVA